LGNRSLPVLIVAHHAHIVQGGAVVDMPALASGSGKVL
jgi:hypothetical protein